MNKEITTIGGLSTPVFYPSVSSVSKNVWSVIDHIELLVSSNHPQFLISCFDAYKLKNDKRFVDALDQAKKQYQVVLWDSGIYEVVWSRSKRWCKKRYLKTLRRNKFSHAFSFDDYCLSQEKSTAFNIIESVRSSADQVGSKKVSPIVHCRDLKEYASICNDISTAYKPKLIAIPERELGQGVLEIAKSIRVIRESLNHLEHYQNLHILGTGNPISMMLYAFSGANSFDGLDWCQTVVDYETGTLHHPLQLDMYQDQSSWGRDKSMTFFTRCYMHNLEFYKKWMSDLQQAIASGKELEMMQCYLSEKFVEEFYR